MVGVNVVDSDDFINGHEVTLSAKEEVLLAAGAVGFAFILLLSGIGPAQHLREAGVGVRIDLPVGKNLQDHIVYQLALPVHIFIQQVVILPEVWQNHCRHSCSILF